MRTRLSEIQIADVADYVKADMADMTRLLERMRNTEDRIIGQSVADMEKLIKLHHEITGQPLSEHTQHTSTEQHSDSGESVIEYFAEIVDILHECGALEPTDPEQVTPEPVDPESAIFKST